MKPSNSETESQEGKLEGVVFPVWKDSEGSVHNPDGINLLVLDGLREEQKMSEAIDLLEGNDV